MTCAIPPLDQAVVSIGRGYGVGYNSARTARDQLHGGMDFVASSRTPVLSPLPGVVLFTSRNEGPRISADAAAGGAIGQVRRMGGYGNAVVLRHDFAVPGLPTPFFTSYNHLREIAPGIVPGASVATGQLLGQVGQTTNGQFPGMGAHLHFEVRRRAFPGPVGVDAYEVDTIDPALMWQGVGIDWIGSHAEIGRQVGGQLLIRADGPSGPASCPALASAGVAGYRTHPELHGLEGYLSEFHGGLAVVPRGYVDPVTIKAKYTRYGTTQVPRPGSPAADVAPPDYDQAAEPGGTPGETPGEAPSAFAVGGTIAVGLLIAAMFKKRGR